MHFTSYENHFLIIADAYSTGKNSPNQETIETGNNNEITGRFPDERNTNSYTGVAWCFGLHNRPWSFHPIFGTVRTMTGQGLTLKYDIPTYCRKFTGQLP